FEVTDAVEHRLDLVQRALSRLDERDAVLGVALRLSETADLTAHLLADRETGRVVSRAVDAIARRQLLHRLGGGVARRLQLTVRVERLDVVLDTEAHGLTDSLCGIERLRVALRN